MNIPQLTDFFMWCSIINGAPLLFWSGFVMFAPELTYRTQSRFFPIPRETFTVVMYTFLGVFKLFFIVFNIVPYAALLIVG